jgi:phosphomevalonate kinase
MHSGPSAAPRNAFVETALSYALSYIMSQTAPSASLPPSVMTILADDEYYSSRRQAADATMHNRNAGRFASFTEPLWQTHKTGLGSSAALVTAFTAAVLSHYLGPEQLDLKSDAGLRRLHNLAQAAHCAAQGKVGSGFDVASAVFGSCVYRRFSPSVLETVGDLGSAGFMERLEACVENAEGRWAGKIWREAVAIPKGLKLVMCDVDCGSQTPGMVKKVLEWRKARPEEAGRLWRDLQAKNDELAAGLVEAVGGSRDGYSVLRQVISEARELIREMSRQSGVSIEPAPQTKLLDACSDVKGVVGGVVPGAGGFDAVALLVEDKVDTLTCLERLLKSWKFEVDEKRDSSSGRVRLLNTQGEMEGVRIERTQTYEAWMS